MDDKDSKLRGFSLDELLSFHKNALKYFNSGSAKTNDRSSIKSESLFGETGDSNQVLIGRVTGELNASKKESYRLKEEAKMLIKETQRV